MDEDATWYGRRPPIPIHVSTEAMCLGVLLDSALTFGPHIRRLSGRCFYHLRQMRIVRKSLIPEAAKTMVHAFITSHIDYCNSVMYGASTVHIRPLQNVGLLNAAARLILCKRKYDRITAAIRDALHWLPVQQRIDYKHKFLYTHTYIPQPRPHYVRRGPSSPPAKGAQPMSAHVYCDHGRPSQLLLSSCTNGRPETVCCDRVKVSPH